MTEEANDVTKALAAFGAPSLRYHSFGQNTVRPSSVVLPRLPDPAPETFNETVQEVAPPPPVTPAKMEPVFTTPPSIAPAPSYQAPSVAPPPRPLAEWAAPVMPPAPPVPPRPAPAAPPKVAHPLFDAPPVIDTAVPSIPAPPANAPPPPRMISAAVPEIAPQPPVVSAAPAAPFVRAAKPQTLSEIFDWLAADAPSTAR